MAAISLAKPGWPWTPLVPLYAAAVWARQRLYDVGWLRTRATPLPTLCVGGLEAGGSGKTPVTAWLLAWLVAQGERPGLLTRGYGRPASAPSLAVRASGEAASVTMLGDEAAMLVGEGLDVAVAASPKRIDGAQALASLGCSVIVMDDGFSHRALQRHLDVVVLRGEAPLGRGGLLPGGTLREPPAALRRADVVWVHHKETVPKSEMDEAAWRRWCPQAEVVRSRAQYALTDLDGRHVRARGPVVAASGVAQPSAFHATLQRLGVHVAQRVDFADHHRYLPHDVHRLQGMMTHCVAEALVVTAKDAVKLRELWPSPLSLLVLRHQVQVTGDLTRLLAKIKGVIKQ